MTRRRLLAAIVVLWVGGCATVESGRSPRFVVAGEPYDAIWAAAVETVRDLGFSVVAEDKPRGILRGEARGPLGGPLGGELVGVFITPFETTPGWYTIEVVSEPPLRYQTPGRNSTRRVIEQMKTRLAGSP